MKILLISFATLLVFDVVFVNAYPPHHPLPPHLEDAKNTCLKKLDISEEDVRKHHRGSGEKDKKDHGCFKACISKEIGVMREDGTINKEEAIKDFPPSIPQENRTRIVDACFEQKGADDCETALMYHSCKKRMLPKPPMHAKIQKAHDSCKEKLKLSDEEIDKMKDSSDQLNKDCFMACLAKELGIITQDGDFNKQEFLDKQPPHHDKEYLEKVTEECGKKGADECETAFLIYKCLRKNKIHAFFGPPPPPPPPHDKDDSQPEDE